MENGWSMERELSIRQRRFAAELATGRSRAKAYAAAYPDQRMKKGTLEVEAKKVAKHPKVQAEVARLTLQLLPPVEDMRAAYEHAFSTVLRLTIESPDERLRFDAARWLRAEYERNKELAYEHSTSKVQEELESGRRALAILHTLYEQMDRPAAEEPLTLETEEGMVLSTISDLVQTPRELTNPVEVKGTQEPDIRGRENESHSEPRAKRVPIPGSFPPRFKTIRSE
jgi:hypothetical protein